MEHKVHETYYELVEFGSIDSGNENFQVFIDTFEYKVSECGQDRARWWRHAYLVWARSRGFKSNGKGHETGKRG